MEFKNDITAIDSVTEYTTFTNVQRELEKAIDCLYVAYYSCMGGEDNLKVRDLIINNLQEISDSIQSKKIEYDKKRLLEYNSKSFVKKTATYSSFSLECN